MTILILIPLYIITFITINYLLDILTDYLPEIKIFSNPVFQITIIWIIVVLGALYII